MRDYTPEEYDAFVDGQKDAERHYKAMFDQQEHKIEHLEAQIQQLMDPIIRVKMLEPSPPIFIRGDNDILTIEACDE